VPRHTLRHGAVDAGLVPRELVHRRPGRDVELLALRVRVVAQKRLRVFPAIKTPTFSYAWDIDDVQ